MAASKSQQEDCNLKGNAGNCQQKWSHFSGSPTTYCCCINSTKATQSILAGEWQPHQGLKNHQNKMGAGNFSLRTPSSWACNQKRACFRRSVGRQSQQALSCWTKQCKPIQCLLWLHWAINMRLMRWKPTQPELGQCCKQPIKELKQQAAMGWKWMKAILSSVQLLENDIQRA